MENATTVETAPVGASPMLPPAVAELLEELSQYAPPEGVIVAPTASMAMGRRAKKILAALKAEEAVHTRSTDAGVAATIAEKWRRLSSMGCVDALESALKEALLVGRASATDSWVPVSWGLPGIREYHFRDETAYLVATSDGQVMPAWLVCGSPNPDGRSWCMDEEGRKCRNWVSLLGEGTYHERIIPNVTHWKQLPAAPAV